MRAAFPRSKAIGVARGLCIILKPATEQIVIAGSLRRGKQQVGDVEIVYVPMYSPAKAIDFFNPAKPDNLAEIQINKWVTDGVIAKRRNVNGHVAAWGPQNKLAVHVASGIPVDLFSVPRNNWFVSLVIRTGSKENNLRLTTGANRLGRSLQAYGAGVEICTESQIVDGKEWKRGEVVPCQSEGDVFRFCGVPYLPPHSR